MISKISLDEFRRIKNKLYEILKKYEDKFDELYKNNPENIAEVEEQLIPLFTKEYLEFQNQLLSYDLSDIPSTEWKDVNIFSSEMNPVDFSKTKANIDFSLIHYEGYGNFKGCNITGIDSLSQSYFMTTQFDDKVLEDNQKFFLSDQFDDEFKNKYYLKSLSVEDLISLSSKQLEELREKEIEKHLDYESKHNVLVDCLGINKVIELAQYSRDEYDIVNLLAGYANTYSYRASTMRKEDLSIKTFLTSIKEIDVKDIKNRCFEMIRKMIINGILSPETTDYPLLFVKTNADIFLLNSNLPEDVKYRYFNRELQLDDVINYQEEFKNLPIEYFMTGRLAYFIAENYGVGHIQELIAKYPSVMHHFDDSINGYYLGEYLEARDSDLDTVFRRAVKNYFVSRHEMSNNFETIVDGERRYNVPEWLVPMNFKFVHSLDNVEQLSQLDDNTIIIDFYQRTAIDILGIENINRLEKELGIFSHKTSISSVQLEMLYEIGKFLVSSATAYRLFENGTNSYDEFLDRFAILLNEMRLKKRFDEFFNYDWIDGEFRDKHSDIFMDRNVPLELRDAFYANAITLDFLQKNPQLLPYLYDKDLSKISNFRMTLSGVYNDTKDFVSIYTHKYGNKKFLDLVIKYGEFLSGIYMEGKLEDINDEEKIGKLIREAIFEGIVISGKHYEVLKNIPEFVAEYPEMFVDFSVLNISLDEKQELTRKFYTKSLTYGDVKNHPELVKALKGKDLLYAFGKQINFNENSKSYFRLIELIDSDIFLNLCAKYGRYLEVIDATNIDQKEILINKNNIDKLSEMIESIIISECKLGNYNYTQYDAPEFLTHACPELFIDDNAPNELKQYFYNYGKNYFMSFKVLSNNKDWMPYLKGKSIVTALLKGTHYKDELIKFINLFGEEKAIKLGISRAETVEYMIRNNKVDLMRSWYDKTGGKFIPDYVVMNNFPIEEADKFLSAGASWSALMRIKNFAKNFESREAMLRLAYSFGVFDNDQRGLKSLIALLTDLPRKIDSNNEYILTQIDRQIDQYSQRGIYYRNKTIIDANGRLQTESSNMTQEEKEAAYNQMIEYVKTHSFIDLFDSNTLIDLLETMRKEKINIDFSKPIMAQLYRRNEDGTYSLTINTQSYPETTIIIRSILERAEGLHIISSNRAHRYFGGFVCQYDPDFREFLLKNYDDIFTNPSFASQISTIQRRFSEIKSLYSNVPLTLDLVMSYINSNRYVGVNVGNDRVARIAAIQNYSNGDFKILQEIYNYGKQRVFSSIPRVESKEKIVLPSGTYYYEMLRLDDPRAMSIGFESDCCQQLGHAAELCMEHSMIDQNGRVFVITNEKGEVVAQSWVWRNKDVLCFDNVEVPDQKMWDNGVPRGQEDSGIKNQFTDDILAIYKMVAERLIEEDEIVYRELLESGKITQEEYDGLRLGKITSGLGYSNIRGSLTTLPEDRELSHPLPFEDRVGLKEHFYISDSMSQYVLAERENRKKYNGNTLPVHSDTYIEYDDKNFTSRDLQILERLEIATRGSSELSSIFSDKESSNIVTDIAYEYRFDPLTTKIILHPNFAIIYSVEGNNIKIGDLFFNTKIDNELQQMDIEKVVMLQIRLALEQIGHGKKIDVTSLDEKQIEIYEKAMGLSSELDVERGVGRAR